MRLVDRLAAAGLAERRVGPDGRAVALQLTPEGRRAARRVLARREAAIETVLAPLTPEERSDMARLHERLLGSLHRWSAGAAEGLPAVRRRSLRARLPHKS